MKKLVREKEKAIALRKRGYSYKEIQFAVPVAKSSLSLWLKDLPLTAIEKNVLKKRKDANITRGRINAAAARRQNKLQQETELFKSAKHEFEKHLDEPLFHTGIALYWAEGAKRSSLFQFTNSDIHMIEIMLQWIEMYTPYSRKNIGYRLYIHKPYAHEQCELFWSKNMRVPISLFKKTVYKPSGLNIKKRPGYRGCIRIEIPKSAHLLLKMKFWISISVEHYNKG